MNKNWILHSTNDISRIGDPIFIQEYRAFRESLAAGSLEILFQCSLPVVGSDIKKFLLARFRIHGVMNMFCIVIGIVHW